MSSGAAPARLLRLAALLALLAGPLAAARAGGLADTVAMVKPAIVAVGTYQQTRRPPARFLGTGFAVADGHRVITSAHVVAGALDENARESLVVFTGTGKSVVARKVLAVRKDLDHDVAVLRIAGPALPTLSLGQDGRVREGQAIAFTGFPIGTVLGLFPVTHRGIVSAITPVAIPMVSPRALDPTMIKRLRAPFPVFQLDATAYPGNSGSPIYDPATGKVYAIMSSVFVKESKEKILSEPSGIAYAIPIRYARPLLAAGGATE